MHFYLQYHQLKSVVEEPIEQYFYCNGTVASGISMGGGSRLKGVKHTAVETMVLKVLEGQWRQVWKD